MQEWGDSECAQLYPSHFYISLIIIVLVYMMCVCERECGHDCVTMCVELGQQI